MQAGRSARHHDRARRRRQHPIDRRGRRNDQPGVAAGQDNRAGAAGNTQLTAAVVLSTASLPVRTIAPGAAVSTGLRAVANPASLPARTIAPGAAVSTGLRVITKPAALPARTMAPAAAVSGTSLLP